MKTGTRRLSLLLGLAVLLGALGNIALADITPNDGTMPVVDAPAELSVWAAIPGNMIDYTNNDTTAWYEDKTGVHINWTEVAASDRDTLFTLSIASGNYPDIYFNTTPGPNLLTYYEDGVIIPLNDLIDNHTYYLKTLLDENEDIRNAITAPDGNIYALPQVDYVPAQNTDFRIYVYKEWLDRFISETGNEKPSTADGLETMLAFFRDNDMNGNGDAGDEIVLTGHNQYGHTGDPIFYMLSGFAFVPPGYIYSEDRATMQSDVKTDAFRDGLRYANRLFEQGLIAEEIFSQDLTTFRSQTTTTKDNVIVAACAAPYPFRILTLQPDVENSVKAADYEMLGPMQRADGSIIVPGKSAVSARNGGFITSACEDPILAIRWLDGLYSKEVTDYLFFGGEEGIDWEYQDVPSVGGGSSGVVRLVDRADVWLHDWVGACWITADHYGALAAAEEPTEEEARFHISQVYDQYLVNTNLPRIFWCTDQDIIVEFTELNNLIGTYITRSIAEFVVGTRDIDDDAAWGEYTSELDRMGYDRYTEVAAQYYFN